MVRLDARLVERGGADCLGPVAEALADVVLAAERLHHLDPDDRLVGGLGHVALARLHLGARSARPGARSGSASTVIGGIATAA